MDVGFGADFIGGIESDLIRMGSFSENDAGTAFDARAVRLLGCLRLIQPALVGLLVDPGINLGEEPEDPAANPDALRKPAGSFPVLDGLSGHGDFPQDFPKVDVSLA